jgi:hypothetical protein
MLVFVRDETCGDNSSVQLLQIRRAEYRKSSLDSVFGYRVYNIRKELAEALEEWDKVGRAPGNICGSIEGTEIAHGMSRTKKLGRKK